MQKQNIFKLKNVTTDSGYENEENYAYLEEYELKAYIKPSDYEQSKKRKYKFRYGLPDNRFLMRGKTNVMTERTLLCTAFDIQKYASKISGKCSGVSLFALNTS